MLNVLCALLAALFVAIPAFADSNELQSSSVNAICNSMPPIPWFAWWAFIIYGAIVAAIAAWFYYHQKKKLQNEQLLTRHLRKLDKLKDNFLANTSHELRTPLFGIIGLAESIIENSISTLSKMDLNNLAMIIASGKRLSTIVEDVLDFAKIRSETLNIKLKGVDLHSVVSLVSAMLQPLIAFDKVRIINNIQSGLPLVKADEDRLQQILHNLIGNAIKFTNLGTVTIDAKIDNDMMIVSVADTGCGIPKEMFNDIFEAFQQIESANTRTHGGTGLGLAISKRLIEFQNGHIWLESELGKGTTFYFSIPIYHGEVTTTTSIVPSNYLLNKINSQGLTTLNHEIETIVEQPNKSSKLSPQASLRNQKFRVLIVDDEAVNRRVLRNHLASQHFQVIDAENGVVALEKFAAHEEFDLVILDVMMPNISGYDVCRTIRESHSRHTLPIIFITAKFQLEDVVAGFDAGGNDFLVKPVSRQELLARVDLHLQLLESSRNLEEKIRARTLDLEAAYKKLEELSLSDPLTGLGNRRVLEKFIADDSRECSQRYHQWNENKNTKKPADADLIFFLLDIDHFKQVNDKYGHSAGDKILMGVADILLRACRSSDYAIRWGGEEFLFVARFVSRENAQHIADRIHKSIQQTAFPIDSQHTLSITCSIGYSCYPPMPHSPDGYTWEETLNLADTCLYAAKNSGRNKWIGVDTTDSFLTTEEIQQDSHQSLVHLSKSFDDSVPLKWSK